MGLVPLSHWLDFIQYSKCSKISKTSHFLFSNNMWVIRAAIHRMFDRIAIREGPNQTSSSETV